jgi:endo-1,4-beta-xylanase
MLRISFVSARGRLFPPVLAALALWLSGCSAASSSAEAPGVAPAGEPGLTGSVARKYADYFPIGAAVGNWQLDNAVDALDRDFNHLTCENAMKAQNIHPAEDTYDWAEADRIADFARSHGMKLTGHALVWHRQAPEWMFAGIAAGDPDSLALLESRLQAHIETVVTRYADVVDNWDVVNEAITADSSNIYRDGSQGSRWYELFGSEEYIYWAYRYAHDALEAISPGFSEGKLYYNDYSVTEKTKQISTMLAWLERRGIHVDGVGFQSHEYMTWPSASELQHRRFTTGAVHA